MKVIKRYTDIGGGIQTPTLLVIHAMGEYIRVTEPFKNRLGDTIDIGVYHAHEWLQMLGLSAHYLIEPNGDIIKQRSTKEMCWHAKGYNTGSVGIEVLVEGTWDYVSFKKRIKEDYVTSDQFEALVEKSNDIIEYFGIEDIKRHSDLSPDRKVDPGTGFDWEGFNNRLI